jgi:alkylation response protein AidB-like acyl-CoA dehydrogenase
MPIGIGEDHEELRRTARRWLESYCPSSVARASLDVEVGVDELPGFWGALGEQGWIGLPIPEEHGGQGFGLLELAVVLEEFARAAVPGPFLPTVLAAVLLSQGGDPGTRKDLLATVLDGTCPAAVALPGSGTLSGVRRAEGGVAVEGTLRPVLGAGTARLLLAPVSLGDETTWVAVDLPEEVSTPEVVVRSLASFDPTRRVGEIRCRGLLVPEDRRLSGLSGTVVGDVALVLAAAECAGGARWCLDTATQYAKNRVQFGRPIGQFQAVKHRLAEMLVVVEQLAALAWDAALAADGDDAAQRHLSATLAGALALDTYVDAAKGCIQVLGGMGFTWEHDAHIHLRRATVLRQLLGSSSHLRQVAARRALEGERRVLTTELPEEARAIRAEISGIVANIAAKQDPVERRRAFADAALVMPHWPAPWGRGAGAVEQLVIEQELAAAGLSRPSLSVGAWALPTIIAHGTPEQQQRWVAPSMRGELIWCQLFSEPGAGSDLAALSTRATRGEGGWVLQGQKVWTSVAARADWGICLARTDPAAPKHKGITYFIVDMRSPGIEVRPLREITGDALFNEVFFEELFVPDDCVVGDVNNGWKLARTTLANERVSLASDSTFTGGTAKLLAALVGNPRGEDPVVLDRLGVLLVEAHALALLGARSTLRSVSGVEPGSEASVRKLVGAEHEQRAQELGLELLGAEGATMDGEAASWTREFLHTRCLTIAGGTSEVQRNVIGERILGLPRDPEPSS